MNTVPDDQASRYWQLATAAADDLDERLAAVRRDCDNGEISVTEAATERVDLLTSHLDRLRMLRRAYLDPLS